MNNLKKLQKITKISSEEIVDALDINLELLQEWQRDGSVPTVAELEALIGIFSSQLDARGIELQTANHPIHIRLSIDYLLNLGITMSDWITLKWAFEGDWNNAKLAVGFFDQGKLTRIVSSNQEFVEAFAGYLILQTEGEFEPYIDEFDNDKIYDWRLLKVSSDAHFEDVTQQIITTDMQEISM